MSKVKMVNACAQCGNEFVHTHMSYNSKDAEQYKMWAEKNITICPDCYKANLENSKAAKAAAVIAELNIPESIEGVSDKQIAFANKKRNAYICENAYKIRKLAKALEKIENNDEAFQAFLSNNNQTAEEALNNIISANKTLYTILKSNKAGEILDCMNI